jgi:hypothetical protein
LQIAFYCGRLDCIAPLIYPFSDGLDAAVSDGIIFAREFLSSVLIEDCAELGDLFFRKSAARARTFSEVPDRSQENPGRNKVGPQVDSVKKHLLLGIVGRICEDAREKSAKDAVFALDHNSVLIGVEELVVKKQMPDLMHEFTAAVGQNIGRGCVAGQILEEVVKRVWQLRNESGMKFRNVNCLTFGKYAT